MDGKRILKGFGMARAFQMSSISGAEDGGGRGDVSPYFITNFRECNGQSRIR